MKPKTDLANIFFKNGENTFDISDWEFYAEERHLEKKQFSKYFKKTFNEEVISVGVFYKLENLDRIDYIAWGVKSAPDCSYNAKVDENMKIVSLLAGCPCEEMTMNSFSKLFLKYLPILFFLSLTFTLSLILYIFIGKNFADFMNFYMASFFFVFGGIKFLSLKEFVKTFESYDPLGKRYSHYSKAYPFLEIILGFLFLFSYQIFFASLVTFLIFSINTIGILQTFKKGEVKTCACLGGVLQAPLSYLTVFENLVMILMSLSVLFG